MVAVKYERLSRYDRSRSEFSGLTQLGKSTDVLDLSHIPDCAPITCRVWSQHLQQGRREITGDGREIRARQVRPPNQDATSIPGLNWPNKHPSRASANGNVYTCDIFSFRAEKPHKVGIHEANY